MLYMLGGNAHAYSCPLVIGSLRIDFKTRWEQETTEQATVASYHHEMGIIVNV